MHNSFALWMLISLRVTLWVWFNCCVYSSYETYSYRISRIRVSPFSLSLLWMSIDDCCQKLWNPEMWNLMVGRPWWSWGNTDCLFLLHPWWMTMILMRGCLPTMKTVDQISTDSRWRRGTLDLPLGRPTPQKMLVGPLSWLSMIPSCEDVLANDVDVGGLVD